MGNKFWVSIVDYDAFRGIAVDKNLIDAFNVIKEKTTDVIDCVFEDYDKYRDYEVEYSSQARHGSNGTEEINTLLELREYFASNMPEEEPNEDHELLEADDWVVECESPFEIRQKDGGSFASGYAARIILDNLKHERDNAFSEPDMRDSFNAGINRGITIAAIITKHDLGEEFPNYDNYMKKFEE